MKIYKIYINYGTTEEFETLANLTFNGKKEAIAACKNGIILPSGEKVTFPQKCIVTESKWNELNK